MAYLKPQAPLMSGEDYIYPITTADQVVMDDGNRLSAVGVYLTYPDEADSTEVIGNNADTLGGIKATDYALKTDTIANSSKLGGKAPEYYLQPRNLLDNSDFEVAGDGIYGFASWIGNAGTITVNNGIKTFSAGSGYSFAAQTIFTNGSEVGKQYTLAITLEDGTRLAKSGIAPAPDGTNQKVCCEIVIADGAEIFMLTEANGDFKCRLNATRTGISFSFRELDLFEGAYTAENCPPHVPKGYANELLACGVADRGSIFAWKAVGASTGSAVSVPQCDEVMLYLTATNRTIYSFNSVILPYSAFVNSYIPMRLFVRGGNATITCANGNVTLTEVVLDGTTVTSTSRVDVYAR